jgi:hypothetical protein
LTHDDHRGHRLVNHCDDHELDAVKFWYREQGLRFVMKRCVLMHRVAHLD